HQAIWVADAFALILRLMYSYSIPKQLESGVDRVVLAFGRVKGDMIHANMDAESLLLLRMGVEVYMKEFPPYK
ncbi:hypothetical protein Tco_1027670, partial [Tanacetum coccineum]